MHGTPVNARGGSADDDSRSANQPRGRGLHADMRVRHVVGRAANALILGLVRNSLFVTAVVVAGLTSLPVVVMAGGRPVRDAARRGARPRPPVGPTFSVR